MESDPYVIQQILLKTDISDLTRICSTNSHFQEICTSYEFWKERYAQDGLLLLSKFNNLTDYLLDYQICSNILPAVPQLLNLLKTKPFVDDDMEPELFYLSTYVNKLFEFDFPEVDLNKVQRMNLRFRKHWSRNDTADNTRELIRNMSLQYPVWMAQRILIGLPVEFYYSTTHSKWVLNFAGMEIDKEDGGEEEDYSVFLSNLSASTFIYTRIYWDSNFKIESEEASAFI